MQPTGEFNQVLKEYFGAECGAYTAITSEEINKQTFNVKAVIRNMLIRKIGRANIPAHGVVPSTMRFMLSEDLSLKFGEYRDIPCKFSKPDKDEMSIYFSNQEFIQKSNLAPNDYWCIYFKAGDKRPWFGFLEYSVMNFIQQNFVGEVSVEEDEIEQDEKKEIVALTYKYEVDSLKITMTEIPSFTKLLSKPSKKVKAVNLTVSAKNMNRILDNKKIKGTRGEEIIMKAEREKLLKLKRPDLAERVQWKSREVDGLGYDIESYETDDDGKNERIIFIEVKSTSEDKLSPFFVSQNEINVSKEKGDNYYIYRVYDLKPNNKCIGFYRICGDIEQNFDLTPQVYMAKVK